MTRPTTITIRHTTVGIRLGTGIAITTAIPTGTVPAMDTIATMPAAMDTLPTATMPTAASRTTIPHAALAMPGSTTQATITTGRRRQDTPTIRAMRRKPMPATPNRPRKAVRATNRAGRLARIREH